MVGEGLAVDGRDVLGVCVAERGADIGCADVGGSIAACVALDDARSSGTMREEWGRWTWARGTRSRRGGTAQSVARDLDKHSAAAQQQYERAR